MKTRKFLIVTFGLILLSLGIISLKSDDRNFEISKQLNIYATLFRDVNMFYVDETNPGDLVTESINSMLKSLDPYTVYYPESQMEDVKLMTTGEYAGIGSIISQKGETSLSGNRIKILRRIRQDSFREISFSPSTEIP